LEKKKESNFGKKKKKNDKKKEEEKTRFRCGGTVIPPHHLDIVNGCGNTQFIE
jgi:hypothetical protein